MMKIAQKKYEDHVHQKAATKEGRDKNRMKYKGPENSTGVICFDLENVFTLSKANFLISCIKGNSMCTT